jgi:hypothetical protein
MENMDPNLREIAFVIDGKVVETMNTDTRFASILLSNPLALDVTGFRVSPGYDYNYQTGKIHVLRPEEITPHAQAPFEALQGMVQNDLPIVNSAPTPCGGGPTPCGCGQQN